MKTALTAAVLAAALGAGWAAKRASAAEGGANISAQQSLTDVLKIAQAGDLPVYVHLVGGVEYAGHVKDVSNAAVVLTKVSGKEFYDIYVVAAQIASVEVRVRNK
jgi:hypothetical protein